MWSATSPFPVSAQCHSGRGHPRTGDAVFEESLACSGHNLHVKTDRGAERDADGVWAAPGLWCSEGPRETHHGQILQVSPQRKKIILGEKCAFSCQTASSFNQTVPIPFIIVSVKMT